jgi:hypothetical protein
MQALDRRPLGVEGEPPPDLPGGPPAVIGAGSYTSPFLIGSLPFTDLHDTSQSPNTTITAYPAATRRRTSRGPEYVYKLTIADASRCARW